MNFMRDILDPADKVHKITWGGKCEFNEHPCGVIVAGQILEPVEKEYRTARPESLRMI